MLKRLAVLIGTLFGSASLLAGSDFSLDETAHLFPYQGLEDRIEFWKLMFTRYGEREVVFHDRGDVLLIYEVMRFDRGVEGDEAEWRRQRRVLQQRERELAKLLDELRRWGTDSPRLTDRHLKLRRAIRGRGHELTPSLLRRLRNEIRYQRGIREKFRRGLVRSGRYLDYMERIFLEFDLPPELALVPHVESSFEYRAHSRRGAAGMWQFMRATARGYLKMNRDVDERLDPIESTRAAAALLRENHRALSNWPLAITAFNHGRNGMLRARRRHGDNLPDIIQNYRSRLFGFASRNFYAEFLAALEVTRNAETHFGEIALDPPLEFDTVKARRSARLSDLAGIEGITVDLLREYNPQLRRGVLPAGSRLRVPGGRAGEVVEALRHAPALRGSVREAADGSLVYTVEPGDTLSTIARRFNATVEGLQQANRIANRHRIRAGQRLVVSPPAKPSRYRVRRGDTLIDIARRFGVSLSRLLRLNEIDNPNRIYLGQVLLIP